MDRPVTDDLRAENDRLRRQLTHVQRATSTVAGLHVAMQRLHGTLRRDEVLDATRDVLANLLGCESAAVWEKGTDGEPRRLAGWGEGDPQHEEAAARRVLAEGRTCVSPDPWHEGFHAGVALRLEGQVRGALVIVRLLPQKPTITSRDHELLELVAGHVALALYVTALHAAAARPA
jgi:K+-sensing histidine kinase KdpD